VTRELQGSNRRLGGRIRWNITEQDVAPISEPGHFRYMLEHRGLGHGKSDIAHRQSLFRPWARGFGLASAWIDRVTTNPVGPTMAPPEGRLRFPFSSMAAMVAAHQAEQGVT